MAKGDVISIGVTETIEFVVTDQTGDALDVTDMVIAVILVQGRDKVVARYGFGTTSTRYATGKLTVVDATAGVVQLKLERADTLKLQPGDVYMRVVLMIDNDEFEGDAEVQESDVNYVCKAIPGSNKGYSL